jgi:hypothetical protein
MSNLTTIKDLERRMSATIIGQKVVVRDLPGGRGE